jgi:hypothetical protein
LVGKRLLQMALLEEQLLVAQVAVELQAETGVDDREAIVTCNRLVFFCHFNKFICRKIVAACA